MIHDIAHDISASGVFVFTGERPSAGAEAALKIQVPGRTPFGARLRLHGTGRITRIVDGAMGGFAVAVPLGWTLSRPRTPAAVTTT